MATLVGVVLGARLNGNRTERREDRKAILASRADLIAELDLEPLAAHIRMGEGRDRVELLLLGIGLSSWSVWSFLRVLEAHEQDKGSLAVDTERRIVIPALVQRANAYRDAVGALSRYLDGSMSRRRTERRLVKAGHHINTSRGRLTRHSRRWANHQARAFDPPLKILSTRNHVGPPGTLGGNPGPRGTEG
ncbi:hypothetical protein ACI792_16095 [Blastococcus sp. SYSU DS0669]